MAQADGRVQAAGGRLRSALAVATPCTHKLTAPCDGPESRDTGVRWLHGSGAGQPTWARVARKGHTREPVIAEQGIVLGVVRAEQRAAEGAAGRHLD